MRTFVLPDGDEVRGRTYADVVAAMAGQKLTEVRSLSSYMRATARRVKDMYGKELNTEDPRKFVTSLVIAGLLERET